LQEQSDITCFILDQHAGKNAALNTMLPHATGDIVFFTDANTLFHPDCLRHIAKHYADPTVGCVTGNLVFTHEKDWNPVGQGTGFYWQYENQIKQLENRLGSVLVGGGSLLTTRKELIHKLIPTIANDLEIPIRLGANGYRVLYEKECLGFEKPHTHVIEEFNRTSRIVSRGLRGFVTLFPTLLKNPFRFWQFVSHKFLRWFTLPLALCTLLSAYLLRHEPFYASVFLGGCLLLGIIALGFAAMLGGFNAKVFKFPKVLAHFLIMQTGACWGLLLALTGQTPSTWTIPGSSRQ